MGWLERLQTLADVAIMEADRLLNNFDFNEDTKTRIRKYKAMMKKASFVLICPECGKEVSRR